MKGQFYQTMWKSIRCGMMAALAFGAAVTFSSCGGGGDSTSMRGIRMELYSGTEMQLIELEEPITKESSIYRGTTTWGSGVANCNVIIKNVERDEDGNLSKIVFNLTFHPGGAVLENPSFKQWWGISTGFTGISMVGVPEYTVECPGGTSSVREGQFTVTDDPGFYFNVTWPNGGSGTTRKDGTSTETGWAPPANGTAVISHS